MACQRRSLPQTSAPETGSEIETAAVQQSAQATSASDDGISSADEPVDMASLAPSVTGSIDGLIEMIEEEAEAEAARLLNAAHGQDVEFYTFWRSMQSYRESIATDDKSLILTTDNDFLKSLQSPSLLQ